MVEMLNWDAEPAFLEWTLHNQIQVLAWREQRGLRLDGRWYILYI